MSESDDLQRKVRHDPRLWITNNLQHPENPARNYDFYDGEGEEFLWYLYDDDGPLVPSNWGDINVLLFCRGGLKTFTATSISAWGVDTYPTMEVDATAPVDDQRYEVVDRFKEKSEQAGMTQFREKDKLSHQKFKHAIRTDDGEVRESYAHLKSRSAWGEGDKLRGLHGHIGVIDESQDVDEGTFTSFATEAVDRSIPSVDYFPTLFVIGTPKLANTFFHKLWKMAEKYDWDADAEPPEHCYNDDGTVDRESGAWVKTDEGREFLPQSIRSKKKELEERIEELEAADGDYSDEIEMLRDDLSELPSFTVKGWHLDQHNSPLHDEARIAFKEETYSKRKFQNEVEAKFYTPENDLLGNDDVQRALDAGEDMPFAHSPIDDEAKTVLSVDWGGGDGEGAASTVMAVGQYFREDERLEVLNVAVFDSSLSAAEEVERVDEWMEQYGVDTAVVDEGYGDSERQQLQDEYGWQDTLYGIWYGHVKDKEEVKWNRHNDRKRFFTANKPYMVRKFVEDVKDENVVIPSKDLDFGTKNELGAQIVDQLTAPYTDRVETSDGKKKLRVESDRNDDIFDAFTYLWIAAHKVGSKRTLRSVGSTKRPGYE